MGGGGDGGMGLLGGQGGLDMSKMMGLMNGMMWWYQRKESLCYKQILRLRMRKLHIYIYV